MRSLAALPSAVLSPLLGVLITSTIVLSLALPRPAAAQGTAPAAANTPAAKPAAALVDLNRASVEELMALKGIGEVRAKAIVQGRPYTRKDELVRKGIVPQSVYDEIREQVVARQ